jgi:Ca-activated chloride channel family protein
VLPATRDRYAPLPQRMPAGKNSPNAEKRYAGLGYNHAMARRVVFLAGILWAGAALFAQSLYHDASITIVPRERPRPASSAGAEPTLRIDSSLVLIPVHVTNALGASVTDLAQRQFRLFEDNIEQTVSSFFTEDAPVSVGLLFDSSGSMRSKMDKSCEALAAFFRTANPQDEFFLVEFNDRARLLLPFTQRTGEVYDQIARIRPYGRTSLLDAVYVALGQMKHARHIRKALVIFSDGGDNWSRHSVREVKRSLLESDVQVYAMGIFDPNYLEKHPIEERDGPKLLNELAQQSGGRHFPVDRLENLPAISERVGRELRSQYLLGYHPTNATRDGKYRQVKVGLALPAHNLHLDYRRGYFAPEE